MVRTIYTADFRTHDQSGLGYGVPVVQIHHIERHVHGNGIAIHIWGEMKIAAKERVYAREMGLNTLQVLLLTPETGAHYPFTVSKYIHNKGELDNYASIDIFSGDSTWYEMMSSGRLQSSGAPTALPADGSIWLNFEALGE